jgi:hypothetical protein
VRRRSFGDVTSLLLDQIVAQTSTIGSWISIGANNSRFALLANLTGIDYGSQSERFSLPSSFVGNGSAQRQSATEFANAIDASDYGPFSAVFGDVAKGELVWATNHPTQTLRVNALSVDTTYVFGEDFSDPTGSCDGQEASTVRNKFSAAIEPAKITSTLNDDAQKDLFDRLFATLHSDKTAALRHSSIVAHIDTTGPVRVVERRVESVITVRHARYLRTNAQRSATTSSTTPRRTIFVGDVHGCMDECAMLCRAVDMNHSSDRMVLVGDLVSL